MTSKKFDPSRNPIYKDKYDIGIIEIGSIGQRILHSNQGLIDSKLITRTIE